MSTLEDTFTDIYKNNAWRGKDSVSGQGSDLEQTAAIRKVLPSLLQKLQVRTLLDIPCGDFHWFREMWPMIEPNIEQYIGSDVVDELISRNRERYHHPKLAFHVTDVTRSRLPQVDLILCRDLLGHLSNTGVRAALRNIKSSGAKYLLATTFPGRKTSGDIRTGAWRPIDLDFWWGLPPALLYINEECPAANGEFADKSLGLWRLDDESGR